MIVRKSEFMIELKKSFTLVTISLANIFVPHISEKATQIGKSKYICEKYIKYERSSCVTLKTI